MRKTRLRTFRSQAGHLADSLTSFTSGSVPHRVAENNGPAFSERPALGHINMVKRVAHVQSDRMVEFQIVICAPTIVNTYIDDHRRGCSHVPLVSAGKKAPVHERCDS